MRGNVWKVAAEPKHQDWWNPELQKCRGVRVGCLESGQLLLYVCQTEKTEMGVVMDVPWGSGDGM